MRIDSVFIVDLHEGIITSLVIITKTRARYCVYAK